jgi:hypothetical protein
MLILTHTWFLYEYLKQENCQVENKQLFAFNILPDLLPVHKGIAPAKTHGIKRYDESNPDRGEEAFIRFHLLLDDYCHYGEIKQWGPDKFLINSRGYTYIKGRDLVPTLVKLHESQGKEIDLAAAGYQSHVIIEMAFDMLLCRSPERNLLLALLRDGLREMLSSDRGKLNQMLSSVFDIEAQIISQALARIESISNREDSINILDETRRASLCLAKFGLASGTSDGQGKMADLLAYGVKLIDDYRDFLNPALAAIRNTNFKLPPRPSSQTRNGYNGCTP